VAAYIAEKIIEAVFNVSILKGSLEQALPVLTWLVHPVDLPFILVAFSILGFIFMFFLVFIRPKFQKIVNSEITRSSYKQDIVDDILWVWNYSYGTTLSLPPTPFCPFCQCQMDEKNVYQRFDGVFGGSTRNKLICERCGHTPNTYDADSLCKRVIREIESRANTGDFKNANQRIKELTHRGSG
jgi:hypothetical protein